MADLKLVFQMTHRGHLPRPQPVNDPLFPICEHRGTMLLYVILVHETYYIQ